MARESEIERIAFGKACAYLNYHAVAKWSAYLAAGLTAVLYVLLLVVLWLFIDLIVYRGHLPGYHELTQGERALFLKDWVSLVPSTEDKDRDKEREQRKERLRLAGYIDEKEIARLAALEPTLQSPREELEALWRGQLAWILQQRVRPETVAFVTLDKKDFDEVNHGLLSLVVRLHASGGYLTGLAGWAAAWNPWTWNKTADSSTLLSSYLLGLVVIALMMSLLATLFAALMREMAGRATVEAATRLRRAVYHHTFRLGTLAFRALGPSEAVTVFTRHVEAVTDALYTQLTVTYREPIKFALLLLFCLVVHIWLALAFLLFVVLVWLLGGQVAAYYRKQGRLATNQAGERLTIMRESLMMMRLVKCYMMEQFNQSRVERQLSHYAEVQMGRYRGEAVYQPLLIFLGLMCTIILLFVAGVIVMSGQLGVAGMAVLATALISLYHPVERLLEARKLLKRGHESAVQLFKFLERRGEVGQVIGAEFLHPLAKRIEFDNVSLREPGSGRMLLEEVSLSINAGQRIGLIGSDDLEKNALVYLIPRLLDPTSGEIRIDQHNLRWVTLDSLRAQMATVLQHNLVFHDTAANNIGCGDSAYSLPQIIEAAKIAHAHHFIQKLPQGYDTPIGEQGHSLTNSQQFRIALARAILRDPALLIIEEPEGALDDDTKALLDDTMTRILPNRTTIFLPHRISTIRSCDCLFLLNKGRIAATGVHKELLAANPLYRHLHYLEFNEMAEQV